MDHLGTVVGMAKNKSSKRVGRGNSAKGGNTAGRGTDGQKSRSGGNIPARFEGGQMPLFKRIGKKKGFRPHRRLVVVRINLKDIERYSEDGKIVIADLIKIGKLRPGGKIKILGEGEITKAFIIQTHFISESAKQAIESTGGKVEII